MPEYEIWLVDELNRISETHVVERADDFSALDAALSLSPAHMIEIWRDGHHVLTIEKGALPLDLVWVACRTGPAAIWPNSDAGFRQSGESPVIKQ